MSKAVCMKCLGVMESKHRHDFVQCTCGKSFLDGGNSYFRAGGYTVGIPEDYSGEAMTEEEFIAHLNKLDKEAESEWLDEPVKVERPEEDV